MNGWPREDAPPAGPTAGTSCRAGECGARRTSPAGGAEIDLVLVNLYPFEKVAADPALPHEHISLENIDIGGPSMVRSAAKNHARVAVVCHPADYARVSASSRRAARRRQPRAPSSPPRPSRNGGLRRGHHGYLSTPRGCARARASPASSRCPFERAYRLRYGENPHQAGAFYVERGRSRRPIARAAEPRGGRQGARFGNVGLDADGALDAVREIEAPAAVVVKHTNPSGVAPGRVAGRGVRGGARGRSRRSPYGGIVALNRGGGRGDGRVLAETFLECVVAPAFADCCAGGAAQKKNLRLLATGAWLPRGPRRSPTSARRRPRGAGPDTAAGEVTRGKVATSAPPPPKRSGASSSRGACASTSSRMLRPGARRGHRGRRRRADSRVCRTQIRVREGGVQKARGSVLASDALPVPN